MGSEDKIKKLELLKMRVLQLENQRYYAPKTKCECCDDDLASHPDRRREFKVPKSLEVL